MLHTPPRVLKMPYQPTHALIAQYPAVVAERRSHACLSLVSRQPAHLVLHRRDDGSYSTDDAVGSGRRPRL